VAVRPVYSGIVMRKSQVAGETMIELIGILELSVPLYTGTVIKKSKVTSKTLIELNVLSEPSILFTTILR
jgi:hypothetical protein